MNVLLSSVLLLFFSLATSAEDAGVALLVPKPGDKAEPALTWDRAFVDRSGAKTIHFVASYVDEHGRTHRLEEWREGQIHLRRLTDQRIDLHADLLQVGQRSARARPVATAGYVWQVLDLNTRVDHRITSQGMLRLGMMYSYYGMAHSINRPTGTFVLHRLSGLEPRQWHRRPAEWFEICSSGQPAMRVGWLQHAGIPFSIAQQQGDVWLPTFSLEELMISNLPSSTFSVDAAAFRLRDLDNEPED